MPNLVCSGCGFPIEDRNVEWVNNGGVLEPYHTGARYDADTCAYIARHSSPDTLSREAFITQLIDET
jgi:hypothetical protein